MTWQGNGRLNKISNCKPNREKKRFGLPLSQPVQFFARIRMHQRGLSHFFPEKYALLPQSTAQLERYVEFSHRQDPILKFHWSKNLILHVSCTVIPRNCRNNIYEGDLLKNSWGRETCAKANNVQKVVLSAVISHNVL